jgi:alkylation response protein AidB-like acyl-CoA dehydrogenase
MNFAFSAEQEEFRATVRRFLQQRWPLAATRRWIETETGFDSAVWRQMAAELGLQGLVVPEEFGGAGFGFLELGIVLEELGRELAGGPYFATACLAVCAIRNAGTPDQQRELLPAIAAGKKIATLAAASATGRTAFGPSGVRARRKEGGWRLDGTASFVIDGQNAELIVVTASVSPGSAQEFFVVDAGAAGFRARPVETLDLTRRMADLRFDDVSARLLGEPGGNEAALQTTFDQAAICASAEQVGAAARCLEQAVAYASERIQFGRPIGSFQAVKHRAAEIKLELELARSVTYWAWWVADQGTEDLPRAASLAKSVCSETLLAASAANIHIHGGMGFTWEHDAHLFYRRAKASQILFGDAVAHRARLADALGLPTADPR